MKRITNYALDCLINQGISKEHIKSLVKAIENQTRDNILTPEQAIEILLDGVIYEEELHQQTVLDLNACCSDSALNFSIAKNVLAAKTLAKKLATVIFIAVAHASLTELVDAHFHWECGEIHQGSNP